MSAPGSRKRSCARAASALAALVLSAFVPVARAAERDPREAELDAARRAVEDDVVRFIIEPLEKLHADGTFERRDEATLLLARCYFGLARFDDAEQLLDGYGRTFPGSSRFFLPAAYWLARTDLEQARASAEDPVERKRLLARSRRGFERVLGESVESRLLAGSRFFLGVTLFEAGDHRQALATFLTARRLRSRELGVPYSGTENLALYIGRTHLALRDFAKAAREFRGFIESLPSSGDLTDAQYWRGEAHYYLEEWRPAAAAYLLSREAAAREPDPDKVARARYARGWALAKLGEKLARGGDAKARREARRAWEQALSEFKSLRAHAQEVLANAAIFESGELLHRLDRHAEAAACLSDLTDPDRYRDHAPAALYVLGSSRAALGELGVAEGAFKRALDAGAKGELARRVRFALAEVRVEKGEAEEARKALEPLTRPDRSASVRAGARLKMVRIWRRAARLARMQRMNRAAADVLLFAVELDLRGDLYRGRLSSRFRREFQTQGIQLSIDAAVARDEEGGLWRISDVGTDRIYTARRTGEALNIFAEFSPGVFLFSVASKLPSDLDKGRLPDPLRRGFQGHGVSLSADVAVTREEEAGLWRVSDVGAGRTYFAKRMVGTLNVYADFFEEAYRILSELADDPEVSAELAADEVAYWRGRSAHDRALVGPAGMAGKWVREALAAYGEVRKLAGWNEWALKSLVGEAELHESRGSLRLAVAAYEEIISHAEFPADSEEKARAIEIKVRLALADAELERGRPAAARRVLEPFVERDGLAAGRAGAAYRTALALSREADEEKDDEKTDKAVGALLSFIRGHPDSEFVPDAHEERGRCLGRLGRHGEAAVDYETVLDDFPAYPGRDRVELAAGGARRLAEDVETAVAHYRSLFGRGRSNVPRARARLEEAKIEKQRAARGAAPGSSEEPSRRGLEGALALADEALATTRGGGKAEETDDLRRVASEAEELRGSILLQLRRFGEAVKAFDEASKDKDATFRAQAKYEKARALLAWGCSDEPERAEETLDKAARAFTEVHYTSAAGTLRDDAIFGAAEALLELASVKEAAGGRKSAAEDLREALRLLKLASEGSRVRAAGRIEEIETRLRKPTSPK